MSRKWVIRRRQGHTPTTTATQRPAWRRLPRDPRNRARDLREISRRLLARAGGRRRLSEEFVSELSEAGFLAALIPEEYGGSGLPLRAGGVILEEIHASRLQRQRLPRPDVHHGHAAAARQRRAEGALPARASPPANCASRPSASPSRPPAPTRTKLKTRAVRDGDHYVVNGQKVWTSRAHNSDLMLLLARTTPIEQVKRRTEGLSVLLVDMREALGKGLTIRPHRDDDQPPHQRGVLRRPARCRPRT